MSRDLPDDDPRKWLYSEHARAKHAILNTYLGAWLAILGRSRSKPQVLYIYEGFAGRGRYEGGEPGSPLLIYNRAVGAAASGAVRKVSIRCVEANQANFIALKRELDPLGSQHVEIEARHDRFAAVAGRLADRLDDLDDDRSRPIFVTVDPFGFSGVPLEVIARLMCHRRVEVLVTFMVQFMRRFLEQPQHQVALSEFFGGVDWRECLSAANREQALLLRYARVLKDRRIARSTLTFRVFEDNKAQTLYYLVHLTNEPKGMREMKRAMIKASSDMVFRPVTLRPVGQEELDIREEAPYPTLQRHLLERFAGRTMSFVEVLNEDYADGIWLEPAYRKAIKTLAAGRSGVEIRRERRSETGRERHGLEEDDIVVFPSLQRALIDTF